MREEKLDYIEEQIDEYLIKLSNESLSQDQATEIFCLMSIAKDMESIGDLIHHNMIPLIAKKNDKKSEFSDEGREELMIYHQKALKQLNLLQEAFAELNIDKAKNIMSKERKYLDLELQYRARHLQRLIEASQSTVDTHEIHMELMDLMKQVIMYSSNIAKTFTEAHRRLG